MHGVFSRASRLTREPNLELGDETITPNQKDQTVTNFSSPKPLEQQLPNASSTPMVPKRLPDPTSTPRMPEKSRLVVVSYCGFPLFFVCISSNKQMPKQTAVKGNFVLPYDG